MSAHAHDGSDAGHTLRPYARGYQAYLDAGWPSVLPVDGKGCTPTGYTGYKGPSRPSASDVADWARFRGGDNLTLRLPRDVIGLDVDAYDKDDGPPGRAREMAQAYLDCCGAELPPTFVSSARLLDADYDGLSGIRVYRVSDKYAALADDRVWRTNDGGAVDLIRFGHRQAVSWPSVHPKRGTVYRWLDQRSGEVMPEGWVPRFADLPLLPDALVEEWLKRSGTDHDDRARRARTWNPEGSGTSGTASGGTCRTSEWTAHATDGEPCRPVRSALGNALAALRGGHRHDDITAQVLRLVRLGEQGHRGVAGALDLLAGTWVHEMQGARTADTYGEFVRMLSNIDTRIEADGLTPEDRKGCCTGDDWPRPDVLEAAPASAPTDHLPKPMRDAVQQVARWTQTPTDLGVLACLTAVSGAVFGAVEVEMHFGGAEPVTLYGLGAAPSGDRKTAVLTALAKEPVKSALLDARASVAEELGAARARLARAERALKRAERAAAPVADSQYLEFVREVAEATAGIREAPDTIVSDSTTEALIGRSMRQRGPFMVVSDEAQTLANIAGHYSDGRANVGFLNAAYDGDYYSHERVSRGAATIQNPTATVCVFAQPGVLKGYANAGTESSGFLPRYLCAMPSSSVGHRGTEPTPKPEAEIEVWQSVVKKIGSWGFQHHWARTADPESVGDRIRMTMTEEARRMVIDYGARVEVMLREGERLGEFREWGSRQPSRMVRVAAVLSLIRQADSLGDSMQITDEDMAAALSLADWAEEHAVALTSLMRGGGSQDGRLTQVVLWMLQKHGPGGAFTTREAMRGLHGRAWAKRAEDVKEVLDRLVVMSWLRHRRKEDTGGRPSEEWTVSPHASAALIRPAPTPGGGAESAESPCAPSIASVTATEVSDKSRRRSAPTPEDGDSSDGSPKAGFGPSGIGDGPDDGIQGVP